MKFRRTLRLSLTAAAVAMLVLAAPVIAEELLGVITKVDVAGKKLTVLPDGKEKEVEISVTDDTEAISKTGESKKVDLEKIAGGLKKAQASGKKGAPTKIEHNDGVASKIYPGGTNKKKDN